MSQPNLYEADFYTWTETQAKRLRELRDNRLDAANLAEEVADLGRSELNKTYEHLVQTVIHLLKLAFSPAGEPRGHWRAEVRGQRNQAVRAFSPGMRRKLDIEAIWREGRERAADALADHGEAEIPDAVSCPFALDDLLAADFDIDQAVARVRDAASDRTDGR